MYETSEFDSEVFFYAKLHTDKISLLKLVNVELVDS